MQKKSAGSENLIGVGGSIKDGAAKIWGQLVWGLLSNFKNRILGGWLSFFNDLSSTIQQNRQMSCKPSSTSHTKQQTLSSSKNLGLGLTTIATPGLPSPIPHSTPFSPSPHPIYDHVWPHSYLRVQPTFPSLPDLISPMTLMYNALPFLPSLHHLHSSSMSIMNDPKPQTRMKEQWNDVSPTSHFLKKLSLQETSMHITHGRTPMSKHPNEQSQSSTGPTPTTFN